MAAEHTACPICHELTLQKSMDRDALRERVIDMVKEHYPAALPVLLVPI